MDPKVRQGLIRKMSAGLLPTGNPWPKLDRPNSLFPMFNEQHWHKTELISNQELLTDEMNNLENNFIRIQAWELGHFKIKYPHITQANTLYYRKTQFAHWYKHIGTWGRDNSKVYQYQVGKNSQNTKIILFFELRTKTGNTRTTPRKDTSKCISTSQPRIQTWLGAQVF